MYEGIKIIVKNYKPFDSNGYGFESIKSINIIIGKNNSGKSSLLDVVRCVAEKSGKVYSASRNGVPSEIEIHHKLEPDVLAKVFGTDVGSNYYNSGNKFINSGYWYSLKANKVKEYLKTEHQDAKNQSTALERMHQYLLNPLEGKVYSHISAERDIVPEGNNGASDVKKLMVTPNGTGATNLIQIIINNDKYERDIIEKEVLNELNKIAKPDIEFSRIIVQNNDVGIWELFFEEGDKRIALSKMGSGIKTILLVLLNLIVRPQFEKKEISNYIFAFEELENNLHPSIQRRLYDYIKKYSEKYKVCFFITTHSNIVIDLFGSDENAQLIHVYKEEGITKVKTVTTFHDNKSILRDLDIKASDLLQSNGIIWVEGPSDRNYINRWIELTHPGLIEGVHYSIMFYGGRLLSNLTFDYEWFNKEIIPLIKINTNAFVVMDRDGKGTNPRLNDTKQRISNEIGENNFWITKGREIENYLPEDVINNWLTEKGQLKESFQCDKYEKIEVSVNTSTKSKVKYNKNKTLYSQEITKHITKESIEILDLRIQIENLVKKIKEWNTMQ